ncbi:MAG TPA: dihydrolipoamide acetyltransferase family protein [Anaerolineaceae bacterium]
MSIELFIPKLGQTVEEVILVRWLVEDGVKVSHGQEILEVETDKAVFPVEANGKGFLHRGPFQDGQVVPVLTVVAVIGTVEDRYTPGNVGQETLPDAQPIAAGQGVESVGAMTIPLKQDKQFISPRARSYAKLNGIDLSLVKPTGGEGARIIERDVIAFAAATKNAATLAKISPLAQRMASKEGVDISQLNGSGPGGRIIKEDVARALTPSEPLAQEPTRSEVTASLPTAPGASEVVERIPLKGVRALIAERMGASVHTTARVTLVIEVDATEFVSARSRIKNRVEKDWGFAPGYNDLLAKVVAQALRKHPYMNARLTPEAIEVLGRINLGMAVDTERGLLVLVIKDADQKSLRQFGSEFRTMVERARIGRALPDDLTGGTFTITNLGMYDIDAFTPVINLPEAAILGVGRIAPKPVVVDGAVIVRQIVTLSLVFDHRVVDGAPAARFLQTIKQLVEEPYLMLAGI